MRAEPFWFVRHLTGRKGVDQQFTPLGIRANRVGTNPSARGELVRNAGQSTEDRQIEARRHRAA